MLPKTWPGFLAVWTAITLHLTWAALLLWPHSHAGASTPVHEIVTLMGTSTYCALLLIVVAGAALIGVFRHEPAGLKILYLLPQQLVLGISSAGAMLAMVNAHYSDGVIRPVTFIVADQLPIVLTWLGHTAAIMFLFLIHSRRLNYGGQKVFNDE